MLICTPAFVSSQIIFQETFDEPTGATAGSASGVNWNSSCPSCLTGDYWEVQSGVFEGNDTNGEAEWVTNGSIDVSSCNFVDISFDIQSVGTMEACGTGCNSVDWVSFQYNIDGTGWVDPANSYLCAGPCAGLNVVIDDDFSGTYSTGCVQMNGTSLQLRIAVQCWAGSEYWQIDNVTVSCSSQDAGSDGSADVCSNAPPLDLFNELTGTPSAGGTWSGPSNLSGGDLGTFDPASMTPGIYTYTVGTTPCTQSATVDVSISANGAINAGADITICDGNNATISASGGSNFTWDNGLGAGSTHLVSPTTSTTYTVIGTGLNGCQGTDQVDVTVIANPIVNAGADQTVCDGNPITLSGSGANSYSWDNGISDNTPFFPALGTLTYTVTGTDANGCTNTDQVDVSVNANPIVNAGADQTVCEGSQVILSGAGAVSYTWDNGIIDNAPFPSSIGTITYTVTGTDGNGCVGMDQVSVSANPAPVPVISGPTTYCAGTFSTLATTNAYSNYVWSTGGTNSTEDVTIADNPITVTVTDAFGCTGSSAATFVDDNSTLTYDTSIEICEGESIVIHGNTQTVSGIYSETFVFGSGCDSTSNVTLIVHPLPTVSGGSDVVVCAGNQVNLTGSGALSYSWDNGITNGISFIPTISDNYTVIGTDVNGCSSSDEVLVTVESVPVISFEGDDLSGCAPLEVTFTNNTIGNFIDCSWNLGNGEVINDCGEISSVFNSSGLFDVTLTLTTLGGCTASETYGEYIFVEDSPIASFSASETLLNDFNTEVFFNNTSTGASSYEWDFGDGTQSVEENPSHEYDISFTPNFTAELVATSLAGCSDTSRIEIRSEDDLIYYIPNSFTPDGDEFNQVFEPVFTEGFDPYDYTLLIFNRWGEIVFESHDVSIGWDGTYTNSTKVAAGVFIWKIEFKTLMSDERISNTGHVNVIR